MSEYEVGDPWPCPSCTKHMDDTPTVEAVDGDFVRGEICGSWWHADTRLPKDQYETTRHVDDMFHAGKHTLNAGEWVTGPSTVYSMATASDALLDAIGDVDVNRVHEYDWSHEFGATAAFAKDQLIKLLQAMDGRHVRLELQDDGLLRAAAVNWKFQPTFGLLAPIREEARERLIDRHIVDSDVFDTERGETGE